MWLFYIFLVVEIFTCEPIVFFHVEVDVTGDFKVRASMTDCKRKELTGSFISEVK